MNLDHDIILSRYRSSEALGPIKPNSHALNNQVLIATHTPAPALAPHTPAPASSLCQSWKFSPRPVRLPGCTLFPQCRSDRHTGQAIQHWSLIDLLAEFAMPPLSELLLPFKEQRLMVFIGIVEICELAPSSFLKTHILNLTNQQLFHNQWHDQWQSKRKICKISNCTTHWSRGSLSWFTVGVIAMRPHWIFVT